MSRWKKWSLALAVSAVSPACAPDPANVQGDRVAGLYNFFFAIAAVIFVVVAGLIAWSLVRYRRAPDDGDPPQFETNLPLEIVWFAIPQLIVVVLFVASLTTGNTVNEQEAEPATTVEVQGFQWGWRFTYDNGVQVTGRPDEPAEIVLPVDEPVAFVLTSRDVVHAFYVPRWLIKRDMVPGAENRLDVTIDEPGTYTGLCAEFCGLLHDRMTFTVRAVSEQEWRDWVEAAAHLEGEP